MKSSGKILIALCVLLVVAVAGYLSFGGGRSAHSELASSQQSTSSTTETSSGAQPEQSFPSGRLAALDSPQSNTSGQTQAEVPGGLQTSAGPSLQPAASTGGEQPAATLDSAVRVAEPLPAGERAPPGETAAGATTSAPQSLWGAGSGPGNGELAGGSSTSAGSTGSTLGWLAEQQAGGQWSGANLSAFQLYEQVTRQPVDFYDISELERAQWRAFKEKYGKSYAGEQEELRRLELFIDNSRFIEAFNRFSSGSHFRLGMNAFGDLSSSEINERLVGPLVSWSQAIGQQQSALPAPIKILAAGTRLSLGVGGEQSSLEATTSGQLAGQQPGVDYSHLEAGPPPDMGACRESAVFAAAASLECKINQQLAAAGKSPEAEPLEALGASKPEGAPKEESASAKVKLSEQQLLNCLAASGAPVCSGALSMVQVFEYLQRSSLRLAGQQEFAALAQAGPSASGPAGGPSCDLLPLGKPAFRLEHFTQVHRDNLDEALQNSGPQVVAIDASQPTFHFYKSGVYHELNCSQDAYNLHLLLVGQQSQQPLQTQTLGGEPQTPETITGGQAGEERDRQGAAPAASHILQQTPAGLELPASYLARASFGPDWGENGHIRLAKDPAKNKCLPQNFAIYPNVIFA